ncbi:glycosyl hydrolase family 18 protein [bacterium]|uniref:glycosyl hydrolase family 18 protein n=1 Tax=Lachnospiraceae TaxID=186803 RepID=UPI002A2F53C4|nr:glycosyl hydrolase family 18 protein [bacterium]MCI7150536.1 glycosyl hydrolase family 18 protein [bacterium]MDD6515187.1 glycosyl hydrolase family 18 protein [bacterium]
MARTSSGKNARRRKKKRKKRISPILIILLLCILAAGLVGGALIWNKYGPTKEKYDLNEYFGIESEEQVGITINNEVIEAGAMRVDGHLYLSYEVVRDYLNDRFYWDPNENILLYTLPREMVRASVGSKDYTISKETKSEDYVILKTNGSTAYIAADFVQQYTNMDYQVYENPDRVMIVNEFGETTTAVLKRDTRIRLKGGAKSPILTEVKKGDKVTVIDQVEGWKKVRTEDGIIGYLRASMLRKEATEITSREFTEEEFTSITSDKTINLAWHQVASTTANSTVLETIANTKGLTTLSPTWFSVADNNGNLNSIASQEYVNYAHQSGIDVWALVDNFGDNIDQMELLSHTSARENLENQLISEALKTGIDGINVDFEKIPKEVGEHYIQFIRELSVKCRINNLVLSVDNYVPKGYNEHYHRKEQGIVADYVIIMGYDEHFSGSYEAGSVASYEYVKEGIEEALKDIPAEKLINAVPFYTRLWKEVPKTEEELAEQEGTEAANYPMKVTSEAMGMKAAAAKVSEAGVTAVWDDTVKQNYAEWTGADGATYKIWLEDAQSLEAKLELMKANKLAGTAAWKIGFETSDIWELILKYVN